MTPLLFSALALIACFYIAVNIALAVGVWTLRRGTNPHSPKVSVIVAARNEEAHLAALVERLANQDYLNLQILIVNDRSTDGTEELLSSLTKRFSRVRTLKVTETYSAMPAKKFALEQGIRASDGEILCFTDADCLPPPGWVSSLVRQFEGSVGLVAGYSPFLPDSTGSPLLGLFLGFEELRAATWSAGSIGWKLGWLCSGRNLAYRRAVWDEVGGYEKIKHSISGDDDLFLQLVRRTTRWQIRYAAQPESHVPTVPPSSWGEFLNQRKRHFSAGKFFTLPMKAFFSAYHGANLLLYLAFVFGLLSGAQPLVWAFVAKAASDVLVMVSGQSIERRPGYVLVSPLLEFLYLCYNALVGPLGMKGSFRWKP